MAITISEKTNLRQADSKVIVTGRLAEKDLKIEKDEKGFDRIVGSIVLQTSDKNSVRFGIRASSKTKAGTDSKTYPGIKTVMDEYQSVADVGVEDADIVTVSGGTLNAYRSTNSGNEIIAFQTNFMNREKDKEKVFGATLDVELYISGFVPERVKVGEDVEETGRLIVKGWFPTFTGIEPIELIAPEDLADAVESEFEVGQTVLFYTEIINERHEETKIIPVKIGKPKTEKKVTYKNELIITGCSEAYEVKEEGDEGDFGTNGLPWAYDAEAIRKAIQERTNQIEAEKANAGKPKTNTKPSGAKHGGRTLGF